MFDDRADAGRKLARRLEIYRNEGVLVLAIPCGGSEIGIRVAEYLDADFSLLIARKLPFPFNPESGFGAIAEDGSTFLYPGYERTIPPEEVTAIKEEQTKEIRRRIAVLRGGKPLPPLEGRTVILVDDGIAVGSTMRASIKMCKKRGAGKIAVAVPVTGKETAEQISRTVDDLVVLETPEDFHAVAQVYRRWCDVSDEEVLALLKRWNKRSP